MEQESNRSDLNKLSELHGSVSTHRSVHENTICHSIKYLSTPPDHVLSELHSISRQFLVLEDLRETFDDTFDVDSLMALCQVMWAAHHKSVGPTWVLHYFPDPQLADRPPAEADR